MIIAKIQAGETDIQMSFIKYNKSVRIIICNIVIAILVTYHLQKINRQLNKTL